MFSMSINKMLCVQLEICITETIMKQKVEVSKISCIYGAVLIICGSFLVLPPALSTQCFRKHVWEIYGFCLHYW